MVKIGDVVEGRYRILRTLGQGGLGTVFLAEHALIKRQVAIKILHEDWTTEAAVIEHYMNEARAAGTLGHPNIVESTDMGCTSAGAPYIVFELLEGMLLTDEIYRVGGLPVRRAVRIAHQITSALAAAHQAGIVHRALESDNIFLTDKDNALDHVKLLDFGQRHVAACTPEYMAPEQIDAPDAIDKRSDIYALGVVLYEMLTARRPFSNEDDPRELLHRIATYPPPPLLRPEVPPPLEALIHKLLAKHPDDRFQTMADVQAALEPFATRDRDSALMPHPASMRDTPLPGSMPILAMPAPARPITMYALAGCGIVVGALGLAFGLAGHGVERAPVAIAQPAAAVPVAKQVAKIDVTLEADAPNARVVFRRRVAAAPATLTIGATDVVELVEVSAPGYRTQRYWLTFDRPTHLKAHLAKGTGMTEATEEETLVALGELAAPVTAAAPVAAPVAMTVRRIGRAAAEEAPAVEAPAPAAPQIELTTEAPPVEQPAPAADPVASVELPKPAEVPAPPMPPAPVDDPVQPEQPSIDKATVSSVIGAHRPEVLKCFADGKKADRAMRGTLDLQLAVDAAGKVKHIQVQSTLNNPLVAACVVRSANAWRFPSRGGEELATVNYPFTIN